MPSFSNDRGGDVSLDFAVDELVASLSQAGRSSAFGLDPARRRTVRTDTSTLGVVSRTLGHYTGDDDDPDSVTEPDGSITRNVTGLGPLAAAATGSPTSPVVMLQLANRTCTAKSPP